MPIRLPKPTQWPQPKTSQVELGKWGEHQALVFLRQLGYKILRQNLRVGKSELDLIALDPEFDEIVIVEVKTRSSNFGGHPSQSVSGKKWFFLARASYFVLKTWNFSKSIRFDIISLSPNGLEHFKNVTWP